MEYLQARLDDIVCCMNNTYLVALIYVLVNCFDNCMIYTTYVLPMWSWGCYYYSTQSYLPQNKCVCKQMLHLRNVECYWSPMTSSFPMTIIHVFSRNKNEHFSSRWKQTKIFCHYTIFIAAPCRESPPWLSGNPLYNHLCIM